MLINEKGNYRGKNVEICVVKYEFSPEALYDPKKINVISGKLDLAKYIKFSTGEEIEFELGKGVSMTLRLMFSEADREEDAELFADEKSENMDEEEKKEEETKDEEGATGGADGVPNPYGDQPETENVGKVKSGFIDMVKKAKVKVEKKKDKEATPAAASTDISDQPTTVSEPVTYSDSELAKELDEYKLMIDQLMEAKV